LTAEIELFVLKRGDTASCRRCKPELSNWQFLVCPTAILMKVQDYCTRLFLLGLYRNQKLSDSWNSFDVYLVYLLLHIVLLRRKIDVKR